MSEEPLDPPPPIEERPSRPLSEISENEDHNRRNSKRESIHKSRPASVVVSSDENKPPAVLTLNLNDYVKQASRSPILTSPVEQDAPVHPSPTTKPAITKRMSSSAPTTPAVAQSSSMGGAGSGDRVARDSTQTSPRSPASPRSPVPPPKSE
jgi:hypothetical protein